MASGEEEIEGELHEPDEIDWLASKGELSTLEINVAGVYCQHKLLCMGMRYGEATFFLYQAEGKNYSFGLWQDVEQAILKWTELESFIMEEEDRLILFHASHFLELLKRISRIPVTVHFKTQLSLSGLPGDVQASFVMDSASIILMTQRMEEMEKRAAQSAASASFYLQTSHLQAVQQARLLEEALFTATVSPTSTPVIISTPTPPVVVSTPPVGVSTSPVGVSTSPVVVSTSPVVVSTPPVVVSTPPVVVTDPPKPPVVDLTSVQARKAQFEALATAAAAVRQAGPIGGPSRRLPVGAVPAVGGAPGTAAGGVAAGFGRAPIQRPAGAAAAPSPVAAPRPSTGAARGTGPVSWRPAGGLAAPPGSGVEDSICLTKFELPALEKGVGSFRYSREELTYLRSLLNMSTPSGFTTRKWREFVSLRPGVRHVCWEDFDALVPLFRSGPLISSLTNAVSFSRQFEDLTLTGNPSHGPELRAIVEQLKGAIFEVLEHVPARNLSTNLIVLRQITRDSITREHISQWTLKQLIAVYDISICVLYSVLCQAFHLSLARR